MGGPPKDGDHVSGLATFHECTTIMFMDIVGFTSMSKEVQPDQVGGGGKGMLHNPCKEVQPDQVRRGGARTDNPCTILIGSRHHPPCISMHSDPPLY